MKKSEMQKVVSAVSTLVLFFWPCFANFWSVVCAENALYK